MKKLHEILLLGFFTLGVNSSLGIAEDGLFRSMPLEKWIPLQETISLKNLLKNISPPGTSPGVVVASPSKQNPDYWYHWVRDAALVMDLIVDQYIKSQNPELKAQYLNLIWDYVNFSHLNQHTPTPSGGPGEPKFHVDGSAFVGPWGRPQNDGPALRALTLIKFARALISETKAEEAWRLFGIIKYDLEFVSHHWTEPCFDLWEEIKGQHFYTLMVQYQSMVAGGAYVSMVGDSGAAKWYIEQSKKMEIYLERHWDKRNSYILSTLNRVGGIDYKRSNLDASVILAVLHANTDSLFSLEDSRVQSTLLRLKQTFKALYSINQSGPEGIGVGRYPEDKYDGYSSSGEGNPWILITNGFAEYYFRLAKRFQDRGNFIVTPLNQSFFKDLGLNLPTGIIRKEDRVFQKVLERLRSEGDQYFIRVKYHVDSDGQMAEQMNRWSGFLQGARDLTWSYASFLTALAHR